jgi:hypothetical protein
LLNSSSGDVTWLADVVLRHTAAFSAVAFNVAAVLHANE